MSKRLVVALALSLAILGLAAWGFSGTPTSYAQEAGYNEIYDLNCDGDITPVDVLLIINDSPSISFALKDVDGSGIIDEADVILVTDALGLSGNCTR